MADFRAPTKDLKHLLFDVLQFEQLSELDEFSEANKELAEAIIDQAATYSEDVFAPTNRSGDLHGSVAKEGGVKTAPGFKEAYQQFVDGGWMTLAQSPDYGGQGLPFTLHMVVSEFLNSGNMAFALCPMLSAGALDALMAHASEELKQTYVPKLVSGEWTASMNLTEAHAGSDLSSLKTVAKLDVDSVDEQYRLKGQKIFITWGDHDMTDNIIHIVLAPLEDAPEGVKGLSLFVVPKFLVEADGSLGARNDVTVVSTEHKLGIHGSPTCVMSFGENDGAIGYMVGKPGQGLACMFTLMNHARLEVGLQGVGLSERSYQDALAYSRERVQGRNPMTGEPALIIEHGDVQRMLMQMKSLTDAMRALCYDAAFSHDLRRHGKTEEQRSHHKKRFALLTPITKAWCTELVNEVTSLGIQVHGGMGFIEETGVAQYYRDARITAIYEGTNGIQANDLVGRKLLRDGGKEFDSLMNEVELTIQEAGRSDAVGEGRIIVGMAEALTEAKEELIEVANYILENQDSHARFLGAVSYNFLMQTGYVLGAWYYLRSCLAAFANLSKEGSDKHFNTLQLKAGEFYVAQCLPRSQAFAKAITDGADSAVKLEPGMFA